MDDRVEGALPAPAPRLRVHLDTDFAGDIDDMCALAFLLAHPGVNVIGVTTVLETEGKRAAHARLVLDMMGRYRVPALAGADLALGRFRARDYAVQGKRYWPEAVAGRSGDLEEALALLKRSIEDGAAVIAIGPLTNLSLLEERHPGTLARARLVVMGGSIDAPPRGFPQWTYETDFNFQTDAAAAQHVLETADPERATLVPIEVTVQTALRAADLPTLRRGGALGGLLARQAETFALENGYDALYGRPYARLPNDLINFQHDPLACAVALGWEEAKIERVPLSMRLEGGWLRLRRDPAGRPFRVVTAVDGPAFGAFWLGVVTGRAG